MLFALLALWAAAEDHCNLEAAGLMPSQCAADCGKGTTKDDGCEMIENAQYKNTLDHLKVPPPQLLLCLIALAPAIQVEAPTPLEPARYAEPETLARTWQFVERAAPPSRAPAVIA